MSLLIAKELKQGHGKDFAMCKSLMDSKKEIKSISLALI